MKTTVRNSIDLGLMLENWSQLLDTAPQLVYDQVVRSIVDQKPSCNPELVKIEVHDDLENLSNMDFVAKYHAHFPI